VLPLEKTINLIDAPDVVFYFILHWKLHCGTDLTYFYTPIVFSFYSHFLNEYNINIRNDILIFSIFSLKISDI